MPDYSQLTPMMDNLHQEFVKIYYQLFPVFFALAVAIQWFRSRGGTVDFIDIVRRALISTVLLVAFPEISRLIVFIADGIAERIDSVNNLDLIIATAKQKADTFTFSASNLILGANNLIIATLTFLSFLVLYVARYLNVAMYHFYWIFYTVTAPLLLLFGIFPSTQGISANVFKGMIEIASWKIIWAILGAMLVGLNFGQLYLVEGHYVTLIVMNFVIAYAMLRTPSVVKAIASSGFHGMAPEIGALTAGAMIAAPMKLTGASKIAAIAGKTGVAKYQGFKARQQEALEKKRSRYY